VLGGDGREPESTARPSGRSPVPTARRARRLL